MTTRRAVLALGSNLGDRIGYLTGAVAALRARDEAVRCSPVFETEPVGGPDDQGPYLNMVVALDTAASAPELLGLARSLERAAGRERIVHWGPRTLDVDVLWIDGERHRSEELTVPHPRMYERAFVLAPLATIAPDLVPDGWELDVDPRGVWSIGELDELSSSNR